MKTQKIIDKWEKEVYEFGLAVGNGSYTGEKDPAPTMYAKIDAKRKYFKKMLKRELKFDSDEHKILDDFSAMLVGNLPVFPKKHLLPGIRFFIFLYKETKGQFFMRDRNK